MNRLNLPLLAALVLSGVYLVRVSYDARRLYTELDRARAEERVLAHEQERLKSELHAQATPLRVERTARERLGMRNATPAVTQYVSYTPPPAASAAPAQEAGR